MYELQRSHRENIHQVVNEAENKINSMKYQMETDNNLLVRGIECFSKPYRSFKCKNIKIKYKVFIDINS